MTLTQLSAQMAPSQPPAVKAASARELARRMGELDDCQVCKLNSSERSAAQKNAAGDGDCSPGVS